jgi:hypothetical protein
MKAAHKPISMAESHILKFHHPTDDCPTMLDNAWCTTLLEDNFLISINDMKPSDVNSERTYKNWDLGTNITFSAFY